MVSPNVDLTLSGSGQVVLGSAVTLSANARVLAGSSITQLSVYDVQASASSVIQLSTVPLLDLQGGSFNGSITSTATGVLMVSAQAFTLHAGASISAPSAALYLELKAAEVYAGVSLASTKTRVVAAMNTATLGSGLAIAELFVSPSAELMVKGSSCTSSLLMQPIAPPLLLSVLTCVRCCVLCSECGDSERAVCDFDYRRFRCPHRQQPNSGGGGGWTGERHQTAQVRTQPSTIYSLSNVLVSAFADFCVCVVCVIVISVEIHSRGSFELTSVVGAGFVNMSGSASVVLDNGLDFVSHGAASRVVFVTADAGQALLHFTSPKGFNFSATAGAGPVQVLTCFADPYLAQPLPANVQVQRPAQCFNGCAAAPCQNGGQCRTFPSTFDCVCAPGWTGATCSVSVDDCASAPCRNGATCVDALNGYTCNCAAGFNGTFCTIDLNECLANPCTAGSTCNDLPGAFSCSCPPGRTGTLCQTDVNEVSALCALALLLFLRLMPFVLYVCLYVRSVLRCRARTVPPASTL